MHRIRAKEWVRAYAGDQYPRTPVELDAGQEATVGDEMLAVLLSTGRIDIIGPMALETKPEPMMRRGRKPRV
jgi:hypothetical protein